MVSDGWSFEFGYGQFVCHASIVGTCTVAQGSNAVTGSSVALPGNRTTIVGRQVLFSGQAPIYDVVDNSSASAFTIGEAYGGVSGSIAFEITNVYFTPEISRNDFESLRSFTDPPMNVQLPYSFTFEEINNIDPQRSSANTPFLLADAGWNTAYLAALPSGVIDSLGYTSASSPLPRKELYPRQQSNYNYRYWYKKRGKALINPSDPLPGFIRGDAIFEGCLADLAMWDGTPASPRRPNPVKYNIHEKKFNQLVQDMQIIDGSVMQREYTTMLASTRLPYPQAFYNSAWAQLHPSSTADIGGFAFGVGDDF